MKIAIIGGGNMGGAIARGLCEGSLVKPEDIAVSDPQKSLLEGLRQYNSQLRLTSNNFEAVEGADVVLLAVKPWLMEFVVTTLKQKLDYSKQIIGSIAATVTFERLDELLEKEDEIPAVFRIVPNIAISIRKSMTFVAASNATEEQTGKILALFNELGKTKLIDESHIEGATALASCGTAFALRYVRAASEGGVELGFNATEAKEIVMQTVKGAVELLEASGKHPEEMIDQVTTPGGITIKGLNEMEHAGFTSAVIRGHKAAK
ncbi:pyrroline-5-carboxylate reductase [Porphyromonadaceae bacterium]